jgi:hypothetical protein
MEGQMDRGKNGLTEMDGWVDEQIDKQKERWTDRQTERWKDIRTDGWAEGQRDRQTRMDVQMSR